MSSLLANTWQSDTRCIAPFAHVMHSWHFSHLMFMILLWYNTLLCSICLYILITYYLKSYDALQSYTPSFNNVLIPVALNLFVSILHYSSGPPLLSNLRFYNMLFFFLEIFLSQSGHYLCQTVHLPHALQMFLWHLWLVSFDLPLFFFCLAICSCHLDDLHYMTSWSWYHLTLLFLLPLCFLCIFTMLSLSCTLFIFSIFSSGSLAFL